MTAPFHEILNHAWQSTLVAAAAGLLALVLRRDSARARYGLWLAASLKFLVPFSLLVSVGNHVGGRKVAAIPAPAFPAAIEQISEPFAPAVRPLSASAAPAGRTEAVLGGIWCCGCVVVLAIGLRRWWRVRAVVRSARPLIIAGITGVRSSPAFLEPGVFGIFRQVLLLPDGIKERLTPAQFDAILAHEWCHVRRHDNLAAALHMAVEALFWFHPLVWWIGARLVDERERACDEQVLEQGILPAVYAQGILEVCRLYLEPRSTCVARVTGSNLKKRIEAIMRQPIGYPLSAGKKLLLTSVGIAAVGAPFAIGLWTAPASPAATAASTGPIFEVATVKPGDANDPQFGLMTGNGRFTATNATLEQLVGVAYDVRNNQISGGPKWLVSDKYSIDAESNHTTAGLTRGPQMRMMLRSLLADRFRLRVHRETKHEAVYELVAAKGGSKLTERVARGPAGRLLRFGPGELTGAEVPMLLLADQLSRLLGRSVVDKTALAGSYDFTLRWIPRPDEFTPLGRPEPTPPADSSGPSIFTALEDQLGLKLQPANGLVEILVVDRAERPLGS